MDLFGEGLERYDSVVAVRVELTELLDIAEPVLRADEHAMPVQHVGEADSGVLEPGNVHESGSISEELLLSGPAMMEGVVNQRKGVCAAYVVDRGKRLA